MAWEIFWHKTLKRPYRLKKVIDQGDGPVNIVLVHGLASRSENWEPLVRILEYDKYRVRSYDLLGFGLSPKPAYLNYSTKDHAKAIMYSLAKDSHKDEQFIIIGHSMGCIISTYIAHKWPKRVKSVILYKPPLLLSAAEKRSLHKQFYKYLSTKPATLALMAKFFNKFSDKLAGFKTDEQYWTPIENSLINTILAQQTLAQLKAMDRPVEIIYGRLDFVASKIRAKKLAEINPRLRLHYVTEMHDVRPKSSRYIKKLIEGLAEEGYNTSG